MFVINARSKEPIYAQLVSQLRHFIAVDVVNAGDALPSVRQLSVTLGINPNTVQKAYKQMEMEGLIHGVSGMGYFITEDVASLRKKQQEDCLQAIATQLENAKNSGISKDAIFAILETIYDIKSNDKEEGQC